MLHDIYVPKNKLYIEYVRNSPEAMPCSDKYLLLSQTFVPNSHKIHTLLRRAHDKRLLRSKKNHIVGDPNRKRMLCTAICLFGF